MKLLFSVLVIFFAFSIAFASTKDAKHEQKKEPFVSEITSDADYSAAAVPPQAVTTDVNRTSRTKITSILSSLLLICVVLLTIILVQNDALERKYQVLLNDFKTKKSQT